jgi:Clp amino terminal domain, pathogenicity island component
MGHNNYIEIEHLLLALLELEDGSRVPTGLGVDKATAEANITAAVTATLAAMRRSDLEEHQADASGRRLSINPLLVTISIQDIGGRPLGVVMRVWRS